MLDKNFEKQPVALTIKCNLVLVPIICIIAVISTQTRNISCPKKKKKKKKKERNISCQILWNLVKLSVGQEKIFKATFQFVTNIKEGQMLCQKYQRQ